MCVARRRELILGLALGLGTIAAARAEDLREAWRIALSANHQLQANRDQSVAAGWDLAAVRAQRHPKIQTLNVPAFLTNPLLPSSGGIGAGSGGSGLAPVAGSSQKNFFISTVAITQPLYSGGRLTNSIRAGQAQVNATRAEEARATLDLLLEVATAYVGVLRANRGLEVTRSNVANLTSQVRDLTNLVREGRTIRNDLLATQVALANASQNEIQAENQLDNARAVYNRLLGRPLELVVPLEDLAPPPPILDSHAENVLERATARPPSSPSRDDEQLRALITRALQLRPELAGLSEQARALAFQALAERAATRPQVAFTLANIYQNSHVIPTPDFGAAAFIVSWTPFDGGVGRRRSMALKLRESATLHQHADLVSVVVQQIRRSWLAVQEATHRVQVTRGAIAQAEENLNVTRNRYLQQRAINTEVLDAETRRVQSYTNFYNAVYDAVQADLQLRHDVGDLPGRAPAPLPPQNTHSHSPDLRP